MRTILVFGYICFLLLFGCNNVQNEPIRGDVDCSSECKPQEHTDLFCKSFDDDKTIVRELLLKKDYEKALEHLQEMEHRYPDRGTIAGTILIKNYINLMLGKEQEVSKDWEYLIDLIPSPKLFWLASAFEMRMKNYRKAIEYLDKIELSEIELTGQEYDRLLLSIHMAKAPALLMIDEYEAGKKEYQMFLYVLKRLEDENIFAADLWAGYTDMMNKAIENPDEYVISIADQPLPDPVPSDDEPGKVSLIIQYHLELISKIDGVVVATYTVKL